MNPVLLTHYSPSIFKKGKLYISEKFDGWRMLYKDGKFYTRRGKEIDLPKKFYKALEGITDVLDGELWLGYDYTSTDITPLADFSDAKFMVFDVPSIDGTLEERYKYLKDLLQDHKHIKVVQQVGCWTPEFMDKYYKRVLDRGGEGIVLRPVTHKYEYGKRDPLFQKKKPQETLDAVVVGYFNSTKALKLKNYVSSLIVSSIEDGKQFKVTFKSTCPPEKGKVVTVRYSQKTAGGLPKFPVFMGVRDDMDLPDEAVEKTYRKYTITETVVDLDHPDCLGVVTASEANSNPPLDMIAGKHIYYENENGRKYKIVCDKKGQTVYCSCEAWKYQHLPAVFRTCKHCLMLYNFQPQVPWDVRQRARQRKEEKRRGEK